MYNSPITIEALLVLDAIESRGSFASAAEQLNKVPSALSYVVQKLEEQLAVTLFVREGRRSVLTPAGKHLLQEGRKLLAAVSNITEQTQTISHGWEPKIRVAMDSIFDVQLLYPCIAEFLTEHPNIEIDFSEEVMNGGWEALNEGIVDLVVGAPAPIPNHKGLASKFIKNIEHVLVVAKGHELSNLESPCTKQDIQKFRTVVVHDSAKHDIPWSSNIIEQSQHFYVTSVEHKIHAIRSGIGIGYLPKDRVTSLLNKGELIDIQVDENNPISEVHMAWKVVNKGNGLRRLREIIQGQLL